MKEYCVLESAHVYVVLEHDRHGYDAILHGVYTDRETAKRKRIKVIKDADGAVGYICILKKPIQGKKPNVYQHAQNKIDKYCGHHRLSIYTKDE